MLSRGALCRLAANAPKTSTHDLPRLSHHLQSSLRSTHGLSPRAFYALSRAYKAALSEYRRSYATAAATKPTTKVKRDVKKAAAKKPVKKPAAKKAATKKPKKAAAKKAKPKKKPVAKPKRKVLTPEQKEKEKLANLKREALRAPVARSPVNAYATFIAEALSGNGAVAGKIRELAPKFKNLTPAEREASHFITCRVANPTNCDFFSTTTISPTRRQPLIVRSMTPGSAPTRLSRFALPTLPD